MSVILTLLAALIATGACAYHRTGLRTWAIATVAATLVVGLLAHAPATTIILLVIELAVAVPLLMPAFRRRRVSAPSFRLAGSGWYETDFKKEGDKKRNLVDTAGGDKPAAGGDSAAAATPAPAAAAPAGKVAGSE